MLLHPHRADVLAALALASAGREPLPEAIERLGRDDPLLAPWVARLAVPLRAGEPLSTVLRRLRLATPDEAATAMQADGIARIAARARRAPRGYALVRWLPVWLAAASVVPGILFTRMVILCGHNPGQGVIADLGIVADLPTRVMQGDSLLLALTGIIVVVGGVAAVQWTVERIPWLRVVLHLWCPEVHRAALLARLVRHARSGAGRHWKRDWQAWMMLSCFRLRRSHRAELARLPTLDQRLHAIGLIPGRDGHPDWDAAEAAADERLAMALITVRPLLVAMLVLVGAFGTLHLMAWPLLRVIENISNMAG